MALPMNTPANKVNVNNRVFNGNNNSRSDRGPKPVLVTEEIVPQVVRKL